MNFQPAPKYKIEFITAIHELQLALSILYS